MAEFELLDSSVDKRRGAPIFFAIGRIQIGPLPPFHRQGIPIDGLGIRAGVKTEWAISELELAIDFRRGQPVMFSIPSCRHGNHSSICCSKDFQLLTRLNFDRSMVMTSLIPALKNWWNFLS